MLEIEGSKTWENKIRLTAIFPKVLFRAFQIKCQHFMAPVFQFEAKVFSDKTICTRDQYFHSFLSFIGSHKKPE